MTRIKYNFDEEKLLRLFISSSDIRPAFMNPFEQNGYIWSTDSRSLIRIRNDTLRGTYNHLNKPDATKAIGDWSANCNLKVKKDDIKELLLSIPKKEIWKRYECEECGGSGTVPFVYTSSEGEDYEIEDDCPICHGNGYIEDINAKPEYVFDDEQWIFLKGVPFSSLMIKRLYEALDIICVDEVNIIRLGYNGVPTIIRVNGDIDIVLMALLSNGDKKQKYVLKYKDNGTEKQDLHKL